MSGATRFRRAFLAAAMVPLLLAGAVHPALTQNAPPGQVFTTQAGPVRVETVTRGLVNPWGLAFLPDGRMLVTERPGRIRLVGPDGALSEPLGGVPAVAARGQGGLLDIVADPAFATNRRVFFTLAEPRQGGNGTSVARGTLNSAGTALTDVAVIWRQTPTYSGALHFGSRIVPDRTGALFVVLGDRYDLMREAQNPANTIGKIIRITPDGQPAPGNPQRAGWAPEIWSIGHRNIQGAALHPATGQLWTAEHGARGGDEINAPKPGLNYGWPVITYGRDYSGAPIGEGSAKAGLEQPLFYWDPSIAPSGMVHYTGDRFPAWRGSVFVGALRGQLIARLTVDGERVLREERMLQGVGRIRDIRQGPDGLLYLLEDGSDDRGRILRIVPAR
jgi:glucose/arabinose dehydrogenase